MKINKIAIKKLKAELVLDNVVTRFDLIREPYQSKDGNTYYNYFVKGLFAGKPAKVYFTPNLNKTTDKETKIKRSDRTSYELLDALFGDGDKVDMYVSKEDMTIDGEIREFYKFVAVVSDEVIGDMWLDVAPDKKSDKAIMATIIINQVRTEQEAAAAAEPSAESSEPKQKKAAK